MSYLYVGTVDVVNQAPQVSIVDHFLPYDTHSAYTVTFFGDSIHTTVTRDPQIVTQWISDVESSHRYRLYHLIVGLDIEWRPSFGNVKNPVATLQLCVGRRCLIFQLIHSPRVPQSLVNFLANPNYTFVGVGIAEDLKKLREGYALGFNTRMVDLRGLAAALYGRRDLKSAGLKVLANVVLEKDVNKPRNVTLSQWDDERLTLGQVQYACVDAFVCFEMGRILNASSPASSSAWS